MLMNEAKKICRNYPRGRIGVNFPEKGPSRRIHSTQLGSE
jgi:hypothetical protein